MTSHIRAEWERKIDALERDFLDGLLTDEVVKERLNQWFDEETAEELWGTLYSMRKHGIRE